MTKLRGDRTMSQTAVYEGIKPLAQQQCTNDNSQVFENSSNGSNTNFSLANPWYKEFMQKLILDLSK